MKKIKTKNLFLKIIIVVLVFWLIDFIVHFTGVGETNYYYLSKFANAVLFSLIWFSSLSYREHWKKIIFSFIFGTWISFYYLVSSYTGLVQFFGIYALYSPPPFVIFGIFLPSFFWWILHALAFYFGIELAEFIGKKV
ncbi:MAG: hypothetical protein Q8P15_00025 [Nanoarchaeota archaeon]|nr:hypothetical protein [Nanoarchaeota archaeon]